MFWVALILLALLLATWFGKPATRPPPPAGPCWRVRLKTGETWDIPAETEGLAVREILRRGVPLNKIKAVERV